MKIAMIAPDTKAEKAIAYFSENLTNSIKKQRLNIDLVTFTAGKPKTLFSRLKKLRDYDIIHVQHEYNLLGNYGLPYFLLYPLLRIFKKRDAKIITTMHTALSKKEKFECSKLKSFLRKILYSTQNPWINYFSDKIVVHQNFFINVLGEYGIPKHKIKMIRQGIIEGVPLPSKQKAKKELHLKGNVYLIIGSLHKDHGADRILNYSDKIGKTILIAGNPNAVNDRNIKRMNFWLKYLEKIVETSNFQKYVRFDFREIPNDLWWKYFSAADLILQPYRGGIGSGIFTDAMASLKPIVSSNVPFFKEIEKYYGCVKIAKKDEDFGKVIKEAMKKLNYKKMQQECKRYLKENGYTNTGKKYKEFYLSLK